MPFLTGFNGCVQYFNVTGYTLPVSGHSVTVDTWPSLTLIRSGCVSPGVCLPSPCSEENTARRGCLSGRCQNRWSCGRAVQNGSCICLHNVSEHACDVCVSAAGRRDQCSELQGGLPLWLIAVLLPLIPILVIIGTFFAFYRLRRQNAKFPSDSSPQKTEQGTHNVAFCFDEDRTLEDAALAEKEKQNDPISADRRRSSVELYCPASLSSVQPEPNNELEHHEVGSISSAFHSDAASLKLSWHKHLYSNKCVKADLKRWGDLKMLLAGFKKERSSEDRAKSPQNVPSLNRQSLTRIDAEQLPQPELLGPVQCLTFEEISKLNEPPEQAISRRAFLRSGPVKSTAMINVSSDSGTETCSGSEHGHVSVASARKYGRHQSSLSARRFGQYVLPVSTLFKHSCHSAAGQHKGESAPSSMFEQWESNLNMHLPYSSYVPVFEDIACLPMEPSHSSDMQSDIEEII